ncbi:MAG: hypothetical protein RL701_4791 [Pseudomonadota bacterium]|jgi:hypothetical protein
MIAAQDVATRRVPRRRLRRWFPLACIAFLVSGSWLIWRLPEAAEKHAARLSRDHGITISYGDPSAFYTAPFGPEEATASGYEPHAARASDAAYMLDGVDAALQQYPRGFVATLIRAIFICGELRMGGVRAGGTAGPAWIVLAAAPDRNAASLRETGYLGVHHELSSLVLYHTPSTNTDWLALESKDANFVLEAGAALARGDDSNPDPATGFLSAYGATNPENDFNTYAEKMFSEPDNLARLAEKYEVVRRKLAAVRDAYVAIDPRMDDTFRALGI